MAKFCVYCGKPLEEGSICDCPQAQAAAQAATNTQTTDSQAPYQQPYNPNTPPNENVQAIGNAFKSLLTIVNKPLETINAFVNAKNFIAALILIGAQALFAGLFTLALTNSIGGASPEVFFLPFGFSLLLSAILFGGLYLFTIIFKGKTDTKTMLCVVAIRSTIVIPFMILGLLISFGNPFIGIGLFFLSEVFAFVYMILAMKRATNLPDHLAMFVVAFACVVLIIAYFIILQGVAKSVLSSIVNGMFGSAMSGLGSLGGLSDLY